ncbi:D-alanyl-D-alanine carboxypeptidase [Candidatus Kaiserbacteria bacterium]|nr:D-alanyl-D-alanine carboxypeptidase [Candidatus Kaiserbacteria bacterium]
MRYVIIIGLLVWSTNSLFSTPQVVSSNEVALNEPVSFRITDDYAPAVSAVAYGVFDIETGEILIAHNSEEKLPIASVTKLFTASTIIKEGDLERELTITDFDVATEGRAGKLEAGQVYKTRELLFPLLLESSNDASTALGNQVNGISFSGRVWDDASGLSDFNQASVSELASETRVLYLERPYIFDITKLKQYVGEYTGWVNNSPVRDLPGYMGGKHGYTESAGRTLVAVFEEPELKGRDLGYVLLGSKDLRKDTETLRSLIANSVSLQ